MLFITFFTAIYITIHFSIYGISVPLIFILELLAESSGKRRFHTGTVYVGQITDSESTEGCNALLSLLCHHLGNGGGRRCQELQSHKGRNIPKS